jgi:hypothetical protein
MFPSITHDKPETELPLTFAGHASEGLRILA